MRSTDFPFAVMPQRFDKGGPSFADRARTVAKGATFAFNDEIEAGLRALAQLDSAAYQREVARIRAQQKAYEEANPYESAGLEIGGAMLPALLPGGQGPAAARMAALAVKAPRVARIAPVVGEAALYGIGAADSMADIPRSVLSEGAQALGMYGAGAAAAPRLKALGSKLAARLRPNKGTAPPAMAVKPQALPAPEASLAVKPQGSLRKTIDLDYYGSPVQVMQNPTPARLQGFLNKTKYKAARRIVDPASGDVYVWDADAPALHALVAERLGLKYDSNMGDMIGLD